MSQEMKINGVILEIPHACSSGVAPLTAMYSGIPGCGAITVQVPEL